MTLTVLQEREQGDEDLERFSKRRRVDQAQEEPPVIEVPISIYLDQHLLPPSHTLLGIPLPVIEENKAMDLMESDVGISEYIGHAVPKIEGIIKQRFTDFLVYEIDLDGNAVHIASLDMPVSSTTQVTAPQVESGSHLEANYDPDGTPIVETRYIEKSESTNHGKTTNDEPWPGSFTATLSSFLPEEVVQDIREMYLAGSNPPRATDNGWGTRASRSDVTSDSTGAASQPAEEGVNLSKNKRGKTRAGRGGRGTAKEDFRSVITGPITSKETRTALHQAIRNLFGGKLDSETDTTTSTPDEGSRVVIKWARRGSGRGGGRTRRGDTAHERPTRGTYPPYIHFTLQKTNRDNQDALGHLARVLYVSVKDLSVAGTKDKRGVTVQRVSLRRGSKTVEDVWKLVNCQGGRRTPKEAITTRGERGIRVADLNYRKASLELGMLKGNTFIITLRNVKVDSVETLHTAMNSVKTKGFINYYGMQRFGTASVPTHAIGLALLKSEWQTAISLILRKRHGEHPDVSRARDAWLVDGDLDKALELMPRRVVAERCILESYQKQHGDTRNAMGTLSTIPRNLRLMYIHAYQSYVWNAIVSERIRIYGADKPVAGDLVFDKAVVPDKVMSGEPFEAVEIDAEAEVKSERKKSRKPYVAPRVKTLAEEDLQDYSIFDVIMPLPGTDVAYPGGLLGEKYKEYLRMDGLDPDNFVRKQRDYTLNGSYRAILHLPRELSWSILRYTDPDVALAQADEDRLLGFDPPVVVSDGKFMALQINIALGTAAYATMALREITRTETSSHFQTGLTNAAEDQKYRGVNSSAAVDEEIDEVVENDLDT